MAGRSFRSVWRQQNSGPRPESGLSDELAKEHHKLGWLAKVSDCASWSSHWSSGFEIIPPDCDCDGAVGQTSGPMVQSPDVWRRNDPQVVVRANRLCSALFGSAGLIVCLKRMAIKEQSDDGLGLEAYCDYVECEAKSWFKVGSLSSRAQV